MCGVTNTSVLVVDVEHVSLALAIIPSPLVLTAAILALTSATFLTLVNIYCTIRSTQNVKLNISKKQTSI